MDQVMEKLRWLKDLAKSAAEIGGDNLIEVADSLHEIETAVRSAGEFLNTFKTRAAAPRQAAEGDEADEGDAADDLPDAAKLGQYRVELHRLRDEFAVVKRQAPAGMPAGAPVAAIGPLWRQLIADIAIKLIDSLIKQLGGDLLTASRARKQVPTDR